MGQDAREVKNVYDLQMAYDKTHPDEPFFDEKTLEFWGEDMAETELDDGTVEVVDCRGAKHTCYRIAVKQHNSPSGDVMDAEYYFDAETFDVVMPV